MLPYAVRVVFCIPLSGRKLGMVKYGCYRVKVCSCLHQPGAGRMPQVVEAEIGDTSFINRFPPLAGEIPRTVRGPLPGVKHVAR